MASSSSSRLHWLPLSLDAGAEGPAPVDAYFKPRATGVQSVGGGGHGRDAFVFFFFFSLSPFSLSSLRRHMRRRPRGGGRVSWAAAAG